VHEQMGPEARKLQPGVLRGAALTSGAGRLYCIESAVASRYICGETVTCTRISCSYSQEGQEGKSHALYPSGFPQSMRAPSENPPSAYSGNKG
jgi:hypothetical protein